MFCKTVSLRLVESSSELKGLYNSGPLSIPARVAASSRVNCEAETPKYFLLASSTPQTPLPK